MIRFTAYPFRARLLSLLQPLGRSLPQALRTPLKRVVLRWLVPRPAPPSPISAPFPGLASSQVGRVQARLDRLIDTSHR